jgi:hypothetical protein
MSYKICFRDGTVKEFETLSKADLSKANLSKANLSEANLSEADLSKADLRGADLSKANLSKANLSEADLSRANLSEANLSEADLSKANLSEADLSEAKELLSPSDYMAQNFEKTSDGYIAYKTFNEHYNAPENWNIEPGSILADVANFTRTDNCGCGINIATKKWVCEETSKPEIWKCLLRWEWLPGVCVPYGTDGKIRCEKIELMEMIKRDDFNKEDMDDAV